MSGSAALTTSQRISNSSRLDLPSNSLIVPNPLWNGDMFSRSTMKAMRSAIFFDAEFEFLPNLTHRGKFKPSFVSSPASHNRLTDKLSCWCAWEISYAQRSKRKGAAVTLSSGFVVEGRGVVPLRCSSSAFECLAADQSLLSTRALLLTVCWPLILSPVF